MDILEKVVDAKNQGIPLVLLSVVDAKGSSPREIGAKMIVWQDGTTDGTIGGGAIEKQAVEEAKLAFQSGESKFVHYDLTDLKMQCGGQMSVFVESILPKSRLVIFGAGHIGLSLSRLGDMLNFSVTVVDDRPEFANEERFPTAQSIINKSYSGSFTDLNLANAYIVIVTYKHMHDEEILHECVKHPFAYLGMIGSKTKVKKAFDGLKAQKIQQDIIDRIHSPIGLNIGAKTPEEIAVAIMAEIIAVKSGTDISALAMKIRDSRHD